jgi:hypothetical protein
LFDGAVSVAALAVAALAREAANAAPSAETVLHKMFRRFMAIPLRLRLNLPETYHL